MKIAYVAQINADEESGISKKVIGQVAAWRREGHDVALFLLSRTPGRWDGWAEVGPHIVFNPGGIARLAASRRTVDAVLAWRPDVVYFRVAVCYPAFVTLARRHPMVIEVNSDDEREARVRMGTIKFLVYRSALRRLLRYAAGAVSVSRSVGDDLRDRGLDVLVLGNSVELARYEPSPAPSNAAPRLAFLCAATYVWNGLDKLKPLAERFPDWTFDVIGLTREAAAEALPRNVVFHGFLRGDQYRTFLAQADVGIGTLALHRKGMRDTSALKVREYLAMGLPVINGHPDPDFGTEDSFILELPNCEANVSANLERIGSFVGTWRGRRVDRSCVERLDTVVKEKLRLDFLADRAADGMR